MIPRGESNSYFGADTENYCVYVNIRMYLCRAGDGCRNASTTGRPSFKRHLAGPRKIAFVRCYETENHWSLLKIVCCTLLSCITVSSDAVPVDYWRFVMNNVPVTRVGSICIVMFLISALFWNKFFNFSCCRTLAIFILDLLLIFIHPALLTHWAVSLVVFSCCCQLSSYSLRSFVTVSMCCSMAFYVLLLFCEIHHSTSRL